MSLYKRYVKKIGRLGFDMVPDEAKDAVRRKLAISLKAELYGQLKEELHEQLKAELHEQLKAELHEQLKAELHEQLKVELNQSCLLLYALPGRIDAFVSEVEADKTANLLDVEARANELRVLVRSCAGLSHSVPKHPSTADLSAEFIFLHTAADILRPAFKSLTSRRVLYCGQAYYNAWYLSRALRALGWKADVYNWDSNSSNDIYYHGEDFRLGRDVPLSLEGELGFYLESLYRYDIFHFSNAHAIAFGWATKSFAAQKFGEHCEIYLLKSLGKKLTYSNNGCLDGVSQTEFAKWGPESVCATCRWQHEPSVCSDERNLKWGRFRNSVADFQCLLGGNRADFNDDPRVHEVPEFYCLDPELWHPNIKIPENYRLPELGEGSIRLYHAVGNKKERTRSDGANIKSSHIYLPLIERLRGEGLTIDLIEPTGIPNREVRYLQAQADIFLDMLTYGWFGANIREAMMLAKPVICYIRPEWLESLREEMPEYAEELPIISATPSTVEQVLRDLIADPEQRVEIGRRSRAFALKWHSASAGGERFDQIYSSLLAGDPLLRKTVQ